MHLLSAMITVIDRRWDIRSQWQPIETHRHWQTDQSSSNIYGIFDFHALETFLNNIQRLTIVFSNLISNDTMTQWRKIGTENKQLYAPVANVFIQSRVRFIQISTFTYGWSNYILWLCSSYFLWLCLTFENYQDEYSRIFVIIRKQHSECLLQVLWKRTLSANLAVYCVVKNIKNIRRDTLKMILLRVFWSNISQDWFDEKFNRTSEWVRSWVMLFLTWCNTVFVILSRACV